KLYVDALKSYDAAFANFFARLKKDGIDETNTLFVVVPDENDHFAGSAPTDPTCDGVTKFCTYSSIGEIDLTLAKVLQQQRGNTTPFFLHADDAPNLYINGNPAPTDPVARTMAHDLDSIVAVNPRTNATDKLSKFLADPAEMKLLHMVTSSPQRTPT